MLATRICQICLVLCCAAARLHVYAQSGSADALAGPASATTADLGNDPSGLFHLKACIRFAIAEPLLSSWYSQIRRPIVMAQDVAKCAGKAWPAQGVPINVPG